MIFRDLDSSLQRARFVLDSIVPSSRVLAVFIQKAIQLRQRLDFFVMLVLDIFHSSWKLSEHSSNSSPDKTPAQEVGTFFHALGMIASGIPIG